MNLNHRPEVAISLPAAGSREPIFTRNFLFTTLANLFTFASFQVLSAALPIYLAKIGGRELEVGLVMGSFGITAIVMRPFIGLAADIWGKKRFMVLGGMGMALFPLLYLVITSILPLIPVRLLHGIAFGVISTTTAAMIAEIVPSQRRGEGVGYFGMSNSVAMAAGPALGIVAMNSLGHTGLFLVSSSIGLAAFLSAIFTKEAARQPRALSKKRPPLVVRPALFPTSILFFYALTYGAVLTFLPLFALGRGMTNPGLFFTAMAIVVFFLRSFTGQLSDRVGRGAVVIPGLLLAAIGVALISQASSVPVFLVAAVIYAMAFSCIFSPLMALVIDRVRPEMRGAAMGTFTSAMDMGIGSGSFLWGFVAGLWGYSRMYLLVSVVPLIAIGLFIIVSRRARIALP